MISRIWNSEWSGCDGWCGWCVCVDGVCVVWGTGVVLLYVGSVWCGCGVMCWCGVWVWLVGCWDVVWCGVVIGEVGCGVVGVWCDVLLWWWCSGVWCCIGDLWVL